LNLEPLARGCLLGLTLVLCAPCWAQPYPTMPITLVVTTPPGGSIDAVARLIANDIDKGLGRPVVVVNRGGAGGNIAADQVAKANADGHTLLMTASSTLTVNPWIYQNLPFDPEKSFAPITIPARQNNILVVHPKLSVSSLQEFVALLKSDPGKYNYGSAGTGSLSHLAGVLFAEQSGTESTHVGYNGIAPAMLALIAGQVDYMFDSATSLPHIRAGKLKALAVIGPNRLAAMPEVATMRDLGYPGMETARSWYGIFAPAGTPPAIVQTLNRAIVATMRKPEIADRVTAMGMESATSTPEELAAAVREALKKYAPVVKRAGIKAL
jgi:tripartite-type tricarboxylate transporter receptor subunit TctC